MKFLILVLFFTLVFADPPCINGLKRGCKFCSCYSGYSGADCSIAPNNTANFVQNGKVTTNYQFIQNNNNQGSGSSMSNKGSYLLTVKQPCSPTRKQTTVVTGKNYNCNFPLSPYWTQSTDGVDDIFQIDMTQMKKYNCDINNIQYYESNTFDEIVTTSPTVSNQQTSISPNYYTSPTNNVISSLNGTILTTYSKYPAYLSLPTLRGVNLISDCGSDDTVCAQIWDVSIVCGLVNPYALDFTINCRMFTDITCQDQAVANVMLLYDTTCLLGKIGYDIFTYTDPTFSMLKNTFIMGDTVYSKIQLQKCSYILTDIWINSDAILSGGIVTNMGNSIGFRQITSGYTFIMPQSGEISLTTNINLVCPDGSSMIRSDSMPINVSISTDNTSYMWFYFSLLLTYFLFFLTILIHWIKRRKTEHKFMIFVFFNVIFIYITVSMVEMGLKIGYLDSGLTAWNTVYECFYSIAATIFVIVVSVMSDIMEKKVMGNGHRKISSIITYTSLIMITFHVMITIFDIIMIIFFNYNSIYRAISHGLTTLIVVVQLIISAILIVDLSFKGHTLAKDILKLIFCVVVITLSIVIKLVYYGLYVYRIFSFTNAEWIELLNTISEALVLVIISTIF